MWPRGHAVSRRSQGSGFARTGGCSTDMTGVVHEFRVEVNNYRLSQALFYIKMSSEQWGKYPKHKSDSYRR